MALACRTAEFGCPAPPDPALVRALRRDLRALGYLGRGVDGAFGAATRLAVRRLQSGLLRNTGRSTDDDGNAPLATSGFNHGVPDRAGFLCDWPCAARRYNPGDPDSCNDKAQILLNLLAATRPAAMP